MLISRLMILYFFMICDNTNPTNFSPIKTIIFDFDGVLCQDIFYTSLKDIYPAVYDYIENQIFGSSGDLVEQWMRNKITSDDINRIISKNNNIEFDWIKKIFENDILNMRVDQNLLNFIKKQQTLGRQVALLTNNMDVFTTLTVPNHKLDKIFKVIVNSADHGLLKTDQQGKLFDIVMEKIGSNDYGSALLVDDSSKIKPVFEAKGGRVFTYDNFDDFISWAGRRLSGCPIVN